MLTENGSAGLNMAALAEAAGVSRQTLYRYYRDVDAVLLGVAELIADHDDTLAAMVAQASDPATQLELIVDAAAGHGGELHPEALRAALPPAGRAVLDSHEARAVDLLASVLRSGVDDGSFDAGLDPEIDARLILGLLSRAGTAPETARRAHELVGRLIRPHPRREALS